MTGNVAYLQIARPDLDDVQLDDDLSNVRSVKRLQELGFDPMKRMVDLYDRLSDEEEHWRMVRAGQLVPVGENGKTGRYSSVAHVGVLGLMQKSGVDLLRYYYGRVPEGANFDTPAGQPFYLMLEEGGDDGSVIEAESNSDHIPT